MNAVWDKFNKKQSELIYSNWRRTDYLDINPLKHDAMSIMKDCEIYFTSMLVNNRLECENNEYKFVFDNDTQNTKENYNYQNDLNQIVDSLFQDSYTKQRKSKNIKCRFGK